MGFGAKLQKLRKAAGMTQEQLAAALEVSRQAVSKWETDEATPDTEKLVRIARLFDASLDEMLLDRPVEKCEPQPCANPQPVPQVIEVVNTFPHKTPAPGRSSRIAGLCMSALGGLGLLVMLILSTMIESKRGFWNTFVSGNGETMHEWAYETVYTLPAFVQTYRLGALVAVCCILLAAGLIFYWRGRARHKNAAKPIAPWSKPPAA